MRLVLIMALALVIAVGMAGAIPEAEWLGGSRLFLAYPVTALGLLLFPAQGALIFAFISGCLMDFSMMPLGGDFTVYLAGWSGLVFAGVALLLSGSINWLGGMRWEIHALVSGILTMFHLACEFLYISLARSGDSAPEFPPIVAVKIFGSGVLSVLSAPIVFFAVLFAGGYWRSGADRLERVGGGY